MEDREADPLGLAIGDRLRFEIMGQPVEARLVAIYGQRRLQSRLWLEAIFSDGVLDPFVTRHVGAAWMPAEQTLDARDRLAAVAPNIATARTESLLRETRALMGRASAGLAVVAGVCLAAILMVLASVVAASRSRQVDDATVMHALGARQSLLRRCWPGSTGCSRPPRRGSRWWRAARWPRACCGGSSARARVVSTGPVRSPRRA
jgi:putative ABC transport system permease protein